MASADTANIDALRRRLAQFLRLRSRSCCAARIGRGACETGSEQAEAPTGTILDIAQSNEDFSTLVAAVDAAGLSGALGHPGDTYTVFAPTNAAFAALGADTINALLADPEALRNILLLHVLPGTVVDAETALSLVGFDIQAGNGETLNLTLEDGALLINGATIIATDIQAVNGVIHVIDTVLLPHQQ